MCSLVVAVNVPYQITGLKELVSQTMFLNA